MLKKEVLEQLFAASDDLSSRIIQNAPKSAADQKRFDALMKRRDKVNGTINAVIAAEFIPIADSAELQAALGRLDEATSGLESLNNTLETIDQAIAISDQIIGVVAQIIKLAIA